MGQLFVMTGQLMQQLTRLSVPNARQSIPPGCDSLVSARQPVGGNDNSGVAGERSQRCSQDRAIFVIVHG